MADFLHNLVAKGGGDGEIIQPRPTSLYEPTPVPGWPGFGHHARPETAPVDQTLVETVADAWSPAQSLEGHPPLSPPRPYADRPPADVAQRRGGATPMAAWRSGFGAEGALRRTGRLATGTDRPREAELAPEARPLAGTEHAAAASEPTYTPHLVPATAPSATQPSADQTLPLPAPEWPGRRAMASRGEETAQKDEKRGRQRVLEPVVQPLVVERMPLPAPPSAQEASVRQRRSLQGEAVQERDPAREQSSRQTSPTSTPSPPTTITAQPRVRPYVEPDRPIPEAEAPPAPPPTVHVTIGRVEVRATSPPSTPKQRRPRPPVMSLDEYLRQRAGGDSR